MTESRHLTRDLLASPTASPSNETIRTTFLGAPGYAYEPPLTGIRISACAACQAKCARKTADWAISNTVIRSGLVLARHDMLAWMLAAGGYPWTVIRVEDRDLYLAVLESASVDSDILPFARFLAERVHPPFQGAED